MAANASRQESKADAVEPSLLAGVLIDGDGKRLTSSHAVKNRRRYRYVLDNRSIFEAPGSARL